MVFLSVRDLGKTIQARKGETLLEILRREGIVLDAYCGGMGTCGKCVVKILNGEVSPPNALEEKHLREKLSSGFRLACQVILWSDTECEVSFSLSDQALVNTVTQEVSAEHLPVQRKRVIVEKPSLGKPTSVQEVVEEKLSQPLEWERGAVEKLSRLVGSDFGQDLEVICDQRRVYSIEPWSDKPFLGIAFDLGTTTVACELLDLVRGVSLGSSGALNRQVSLGADVISRLRSIQDDQRNLNVLQSLAIQTMNEILAEVCERAQVEPERIFAVTVAGNTIMEHLFLGISPLLIGVAPYTPTFRRAFLVRAQEIDLATHPHAQVYLFPQVAGYVGGDIVGGIVAFDLDVTDRTILYVDIGTNGEMSLLARGKMWCCGTAAGPAFEGAQITCGTRATLGAIHAVDMDGGKMTISTVGGVSPRGICGTGLIDVLAGLLQQKLVGPTGRFQNTEGMWKSYFIQDKTRAFVLSRDPLLVLTQEDISQLQLAKAAIRAGWKILLHEAGLEERDIETVILAGAFGSFINPESAKRIGLVPALPPVKAVGNASLFGAKRALLSRKFRERVENLALRCEYVELSARGDFQDYFFESLVFEGEE